MPEQELTLMIDPFQLPTAQHRAGLAGLMVLVETMEQRGTGPLPSIEAVAEGRYQVTLARESLQAVLNEMYDAMEEAPAASESPTEALVEVADGDDSEAEEAKARIVPRAAFLQNLGVKPVWVKLWRDAYFSTIRTRHLARLPFVNRSSGEDVKLAGELWTSLVKASGAKGANTRQKLSGSLLIGAQQDHGDNVPFCASPVEAMLLHFWPVVTAIFVPSSIDFNGKSKAVGYVLAVPDVSDYQSFCGDFRAYLNSLEDTPGKLRPAGCYISLPEEAGLEYEALLGSVTAAQQAQTGIRFSTSGVEVFHLQKRGNNVPLLHACRIPATEDLLLQYNAIRRRYLHPLFRKQLILNLLRGEPWFHGFQDVFASSPSSFFLGAEGNRFQFDIARKIDLNKEVKSNG